MRWAQRAHDRVPRWPRALAVASLSAAACGTTGMLVLDAGQPGVPLAATALVRTHPSVAVTPRAATSGPAVPSLNIPWLSSNWSGYAVSGSGITSVSGSWVVPAVQQSPVPAYSAAWIGIDGFSTTDQSLIQAGTEQDSSGTYTAWWSTTYYEQAIAAVGPGDQMSAEIHQVAGTTWNIQIADVTRGWNASFPVAFGGSGQSAEWIMEAPSVGGQTATLAQFSSVTFDLAQVNGADPLLLPIDIGIMRPPYATLPMAVPSLPDLDTDGFSVAYGTIPPLPPAS